MLSTVTNAERKGEASRRSTLSASCSSVFLHSASRSVRLLGPMIPRPKNA